MKSVPISVKFTLKIFIGLGPVVDVIKLFLEEIWKFKISPKPKTARIGYFKRNKQFLSIFLLKNGIIFTF